MSLSINEIKALLAKIETASAGELNEDYFHMRSTTAEAAHDYDLGFSYTQDDEDYVVEFAHLRESTIHENHTLTVPEFGTFKFFYNAPLMLF